MTTIPVGALKWEWRTEDGQAWDREPRSYDSSIIRSLIFVVTRADPIIELADWQVGVMSMGEAIRDLKGRPLAWHFTDVGTLWLYPANRDPLCYRAVAYDQDTKTTVYAWPD
jgi:hypothetical protein